MSAADGWPARPVACETWLERPERESAVILEHEDRISRATVTVARRAETGERRQQLSLPTRPAGTIRVDASGMGEAAVVRLLQVTLGDLAVRRQVAVEDAAAGVAMPAGEAVVLVWDTKKRRYLASSPRTPVHPGHDNVVAVTAPGSGDILLHARVASGEHLSLTDLEPRLQPGPELEAPLVMRTRTTDGLWALWRGVDPEAAEHVDGDGEAAYLVPESIVFGTSRIAFVETDVRPKPSVDVEISLPAALRGAPLSLEIQRMPGWRKHREEPVPADADRHRLAWLPPDLLMLTLHVPPWQFRQRADLRDGDDRVVHFAPEPIELAGTVYRGDEGTQASIDFNVNLRADKGQVRALTDEEGRYQATLFRPGTYVVEVRTQDATDQPMRELFELPEERYVEHDFHLFAGRVTVEVVDDTTSEPIAGASVGFSNEASDGQKTGINTETDDDGVAMSSELRPGILIVSVYAKGYREHEESPLTLADDTAPSLLVRLEPQGDSATVDVALYGGGIASGAELIVLDSLDGGVPIWSGITDHAGRAQVPAEFGGRRLLLRHVEGASAIRHVPSLEEEGSVRVVLAPAAPPLGLQVIDRHGQPVWYAGIALWIDGLRVHGSALGWLTRGAPRTDGSGFWIGTGLARSSLPALPYASTAEAAMRSGHWDAQARTIPFPWRKGIALTLPSE